MSYKYPHSVIGFHSCDKNVGLKVLNGHADLKPSRNSWDWLGSGIYFWELNPGRAIEYAVESSLQKQFNKTPIKTPFILGSIVELGNCLNLLEMDSISIIKNTYYKLKALTEKSGRKLPENKGSNRALDCAVIELLHILNEQLGDPPYDTVRCAFPEGIEIYHGSAITSRLHTQICVRNPECIQGYFLPRPTQLYNPAIAS